LDKGVDMKKKLIPKKNRIKKELFLEDYTYDELCQKLTKELREDNRKNNSRGILVKFNALDDEVALTIPEHFEKLKKEGYITYLPEEIVSLLIAKPKSLQLIHEIKKEFNGKVKSAHANYEKRF
jgi:hypothetical protein